VYGGAVAPEVISVANRWTRAIFYPTLRLALKREILEFYMAKSHERYSFA
jgi:hypothetical protein